MNFKDSEAKEKVVSYLNIYVREYNASHSYTTFNNDTFDDYENDLQFDIWKYHNPLTHKISMFSKLSRIALQYLSSWCNNNTRKKYTFEIYAFKDIFP